MSYYALSPLPAMQAPAACTSPAVHPPPFIFYFFLHTTMAALLPTILSDDECDEIISKRRKKHVVNAAAAAASAQSSSSSSSSGGSTKARDAGRGGVNDDDDDDDDDGMYDDEMDEDFEFGGLLVSLVFPLKRDTSSSSSIPQKHSPPSFSCRSYPPPPLFNLPPSSIDAQFVILPIQRRGRTVPRSTPMSGGDWEARPPTYRGVTSRRWHC